MTIKELLKEIKEIEALEYAYYCLHPTNEFFWDGKVSYTGIKRVIHALWNNGENEKGQSVLYNMSCPKAVSKFNELAEKCKEMEMPVLKF